MENYDIDEFIDTATAENKNAINDDKHKQDGNNNDNNDRSRSKERDRSGRDRGDRKERSSSRERKRSDRDRDRDSRRDRSRSRDRRRSRSRDRRRSRSRDRRRSRSRDRRRSRSRDRRRSRSRDRRRDRRSRSRSRDRKRDRSSSSSIDPREVGKTETEIKAIRELDRLTKDQRTVFVGQLVQKVNERMLKDYFGEMGKVVTVTLLRDRLTGKHKGCGYVEMRELDDIPNILLLNNSVPNFQKYPILVKQSEAEKNLAYKKPDGEGNTVNSGKINLKEGWDISRGDPRIYIGSIHPSINEEGLKTLLSSFGDVEEIKLHRDELGNSKGFAFARYAEPESAQVAISGAKGIELFGKALKIGPVNDGNQSALNQQSIVSSAVATLGVNEAAVAAALAVVTSSVQSNNNHGVAPIQSHNWKLDEDGQSGMKLDANSRLSLMAKLGQGAGITVPTLSNPSHPIAGQPSNCFVLKNMFDPSEETEPDWDLDIKEDVMEESGRFGTIEHCYVEKKKPGGLVFLKFTTIASAVQAANNLNNRFFGKRQVIANFLDPQQYHTMAK